jgi:tetratricopeptide (TPR) repeat protein
VNSVRTLASVARGLAGAAALLAATAPSSAATHRYLVLPFENLSPERSLNWIGDALSMSLSDRLELLGMRTVTRVERIDALEALGIPEGKPVTLATVLKIVAGVRADRVVSGNFAYDPKNGVVVSGRLLDPLAAREIWEGTRPGTLAGIFSLMDPLVIEAATRDESRLSPAAPSALTSIADPPLTVYELLVRALLETEPEKRLAALRKALDVDRQSIPVRRALAVEQFDQGLLAEALGSVDAIPPEASPDGWRMHLLRGRILAARGDLDGAIAALSKSIALGDSADAHLLLARLSASRGDAPRALAEVELAAGLDPGNPEIDVVRALANKSATPPI